MEAGPAHDDVTVVRQTLARLVRERRDFGLLSGTRRLQRQSADGYVRFNTRFGKFFIRPHDTDISVLRQVFVLMIVKIDTEGFEADLFSHNLDWINDRPLSSSSRMIGCCRRVAQAGRSNLPCWAQGDILISGENAIFIGELPDR